jgi:polar amino acid transport system substrate-binding protein
MNRLIKLGIAGAVVMAFASSAQAQTYVVGINNGVYAAANPDTGEITGYAVDVMTAIAADAGIGIEIASPMSFDAVLPALVAGDIDVSAASTAITAEREALGIAFSNPFDTFTDALIVLATDTTTATSIQDFAGETACSGSGTIYIDYLNEVQARDGLFRSVLTFGAADGIAALTDGTCAFWMGTSKLLTGLQTLGFTDFREVDTYVPTLLDEVGISVRAADTELLATINESLANLIADGTIARFAAKWGVAGP